MDSKALDLVSKKLDVVIKLIATMTVDGKKLADGAPILDRCGVDRSLIAEIYNTTPNSVSVQVSVARKRKNETKSDSG